MRIPRTALAVAMIAAFCSISSIAAQTGDTRVALVVGNSDYDDDRLDLRNPRNDAREIAATLRRVGFEVIEAYDLRYFEFGDVIDDFGERIRGADVAAFFYAGHGIQYQNSNYLIPTYPTIDRGSRVRRAAVPVDDILSVMQEANTHTNIVWLDACRDTPSFGSDARGAVTRGLALVNPPEQTIVMFAAEPGKVALDGDGTHSPFTAALLSYIEEPGIPVLDALANVQEQVERITDGVQSPRIQVEYSARLRDVFLVPEPSAVTTANAEPQFVPDESTRRLPGQLDLERCAIRVAISRVVNSDQDAIIRIAPAGSLGAVTQTERMTVRPVRYESGVLEVTVAAGLPFATVTAEPGEYDVSIRLADDVDAFATTRVNLQAGEQSAVRVNLGYSNAYKLKRATEQRDALEVLYGRRSRTYERRNWIGRRLAIGGAAGAFITVATYVYGLVSYNNYRDSTRERQATTYRTNAEIAGTLVPIFGGVSAVGLVVGPTFLLARPNIDSVEKEIELLDEKIAELRIRS